ncbi:YqaJ viral recombinase family protein [Corynebacterium sp. YSMAA1_1_D6]|uniref:YqaJ viral recombinase family protein n=1 Tax=Corynebacterium sp. YSMAA1_1_D6 TaxID=3383589 RepID=UPI0038CFDD0E
MRRYDPTDNEDWARFRHGRLTSTELARLHAHRSAASWHALRDEKEHGSKFKKNDWTRWGNGREPLLAQVLIEEVDSRLVYNPNPQKIFLPDDERLSCTPDLYSDDLEVIGEIKTSTKPFTGGRWHEWCPDQYWCQIQANMHYTGAEACALLVEVHDDFVPVALDHQTITYDPKFAAELMNTAGEWFAWLDGTTPDWMGEITSLDQVDDVTDLVAQYAMLTAEVDDRKKRIANLKAEILKLTGDSHTGDYGGYHLTVSTTQPSKVFDTRVFKAAHPHLYNEFRTKTRAGSTRLTIKEQ